MNHAVRRLAQDRRCLVMGLGAFGGGLGVTRALVEAGAKHVLVTDLADETKLATSLEAIKPLVDAGRVRLRLGGHEESDFRSAEVVIANPAVPKPWQNRFLLAARAGGATVTTEMRLGLEGVPADRVIGITGSAGKSTTSAMIAHLLDGDGRRAVLAPGVEHVGVLYSATTLRETRDWLNAAFWQTGAVPPPGGGRNRVRARADLIHDGAPVWPPGSVRTHTRAPVPPGTGGIGEGAPVPQRGGWIALLLVSVVALGWPLAGVLRRFRARTPPPHLTPRRFLAALLLPALATPLLLAPFDLRFLPVLVADYLAVHLGLYGLVALALVAGLGGLRRDGDEGTALLLAFPVALFGLCLFGVALDRYVASFLPVAGRIPVVLAMAAGAVPFLLADAVLTEGGRAPLWRVLAVRSLALASLGLAVALDFERLFFLLIILPVILVFFLLFGTVGGWVGRATWRPVVAGIGLGLFLGWALAVTFPMFAA
jgi:hypothetical protein